MRSILVLSVLLGTTIGAQTAEASPWTREPGPLFTVSKVGYHAAEDEGAARRFEQVTSETYLELGLTDRVMAGGKLTYAWQGTEDPFVPRDRLSGLAEAEAFVQAEAGRWDGGVVSVMATYGAPSETSSLFLDERSFERDASAGLYGLVGLNVGPGFVSVRSGPQISLGRDANLWRTDVTLGRTFENGALLLLDAYDTTSMGGADPLGLDYEVTRLAPSLVLPVRGRIKIQLGATWDARGEGVDAGAGGFLALWVGE